MATDTNLEHRILHRYPYPIARSWMDARLSGGSIHALWNVADAAARVLFALTLPLYLEAPRDAEVESLLRPWSLPPDLRRDPKASLNSQERLLRGVWRSIGQLPPERRFFERENLSEPFWEAFVRFRDLRNDVAHNRIPGTRAATAEAFARQREDLLLLLQELSWLEGYRIVQLVETSRRGRRSSGRALIKVGRTPEGDETPATWPMELSQDHLWCCSPDASRYLLLHPFARLFPGPGGRDHVYLFSRVTARAQLELIDNPESPARRVADLGAGFGERVRALLDRHEPMEGSRVDDPHPAATLAGVGAAVDLGRFQRIRELGRTAFSTVYLVDDPQRGERALKVLRDPNATIEARHRREFDVLRGLDHPHVVNDVEWVVLPDSANAISMPVYAGTLKEVLTDAREAGQALPSLLVIRWMRQLLSALDHLHARGLIHRDVKPSNLLLRRSGDEDALILGDFGSVHRPASEVTGTGERVGTLHYTDPELLAGSGRVQPLPRHDVYSAGRVLYELLTLREPHQRVRVGTAHPSQRLCTLIERMLSEHGTERPTAALADRELAAIEAELVESGEGAEPGGSSGQLEAFERELATARAEVERARGEVDEARRLQAEADQLRERMREDRDRAAQAAVDLALRCEAAMADLERMEKRLQGVESARAGDLASLKTAQLSLAHAHKERDKLAGEAERGETKVRELQAASKRHANERAHLLLRIDELSKAMRGNLGDRVPLAGGASGWLRSLGVGIGGLVLGLFAARATGFAPMEGAVDASGQSDEVPEGAATVAAVEPANADATLAGTVPAIGVASADAAVGAPSYQPTPHTGPLEIADILPPETSPKVTVPLVELSPWTTCAVVGTSTDGRYRSFTCPSYPDATVRCAVERGSDPVRYVGTACEVLPDGG